MNKLQFIIFSLLAVVVQSKAFSQQWELHVEKDGVSIFSKTVDCSDSANAIFNSYVLLRVVNENPTPVQVAFDRWAWYGAKCSGCSDNMGEHHISVEVKADSTLEGSCGTKDRRLKLFSHKRDMPYVSNLSHFELRNINVTSQDSGR